uniref:acetyl-CoA C-acetyltransferase n=1 Tax=Psychrobacter jeotgali TaxID=179010 RepID=UPI001D1252D7|nr:acetyl-CoA C-acetyltransferase [Psychrobacter jeotgali]
MSNKKNNPIVETSVVKNSDSSDSVTASTQTENKGNDKGGQDANTNFDSIADLKQATDIVDSEGKPVEDNSKNKQAEKKSKIKEDLIEEAEELNAFDTTAKSNAAEQPKQSSKQEDKKDSKKQNANKDQKEADTKATKQTRPTPKKPGKTTLSSGQHRVAILGGNRIPFARSNGPYADASNIDMLTAALNGLIERYDLQGERVGEVVAGAVLKLSRDLNLTREAALNTALDPHTPTYDVSQACGTGLQATFAAANKIALGVIDSAITGGVDTTSDAPIAIGDGLRKVILKLGAAKNNKQRLKALMGLNPKDLIESPQNGEPRTGLSMGDHQAITALEWNIGREAQDELAFNSHKNLARAYDEGFFDDLITPYKGLTRDNNLRPDSTKEKMAKLKPVFGKKNANPTMTAANSTPLTDGASCVLLANDEWAEAHGLKPLAYIVHQETAAVDFIGKSGDREGLLMAPAYAVPRMLERAGLSLQDFDFYEIHEAFASQVLSTLAAWEDETFCQERLGLDAPLGSIDRSKLNVNGSSLAAGHPFAATGGRILATAAKLLDQKGSGRALVSICAAGGQGVTCILEK